MIGTRELLLVDVDFLMKNTPALFINILSPTEIQRLMTAEAIKPMQIFATPLIHMPLERLIPS